MDRTDVYEKKRERETDNAHCLIWNVYAELSVTWNDRQEAQVERTQQKSENYKRCKLA